MEKHVYKISRLSKYILALTLFIIIFLVVLIGFSTSNFFKVQVATQKYMACENAAKNFQAASDYLTEQVRMFTFTNEKKYMDLYFDEVLNNQRREKALQSMKTYYGGTEIFDFLQAALKESYELSETEYQAISLVSKAIHLNQSELYAKIINTDLSQELLKLSDEEKIKYAQNLVISDDYQTRRTEISNNVSDCLQGLMEETNKVQLYSLTVFKDTYAKLIAGIMGLILLIVIVCLFLIQLIIFPLKRYNLDLSKGEVLQVEGAGELQVFAKTYNRLFKEHKEAMRLLSYEAEVDALTEVYNRRSFNKILKIHEQNEKNYALLIIDVDLFKGINDKYGHEVGDKILIKVANVLRNSFQSADHVCRIGGDEFAVIMIDITHDKKETVRKIVESINQKMSMEEDGLPKTTLSIGIAFADTLSDLDVSIFKCADSALYKVKENGRNGYEFF